MDKGDVAKVKQLTLGDAVEQEEAENKVPDWASMKFKKKKKEER